MPSVRVEKLNPKIESFLPADVIHLGALQKRYDELPRHLSGKLFETDEIYRVVVEGARHYFRDLRQARELANTGLGPRTVPGARSSPSLNH